MQGQSKLSSPFSGIAECLKFRFQTLFITWERWQNLKSVFRWLNETILIEFMGVYDLICMKNFG